MTPHSRWTHSRPSRRQRYPVFLMCTLICVYIKHKSPLCWQLSLSFLHVWMNYVCRNSIKWLLHDLNPSGQRVLGAFDFFFFLRSSQTLLWIRGRSRGRLCGCSLCGCSLCVSERRCTRAEQREPLAGGLKGFGNSSPCHANESLSPIRFAEEERHIGPPLNKPWWERIEG